MNQRGLIPSPQRPHLGGSADSHDPRVIDSSTLFREGEREVCLVHRGVVYRLRITRQGKLILTK
jgi:hemin uptake protein HemP